MNRKGFTLIEILGTLALIAVATIIILRQTTATLSISNSEAYKLMKNNIIIASENYIKENEAGIIKTDFSLAIMKNSFRLIL